MCGGEVDSGRRERGEPATDRTGRGGANEDVNVSVNASVGANAAGVSASARMTMLM